MALDPRAASKRDPIGRAALGWVAIAVVVAWMNAPLDLAGQVDSESSRDRGMVARLSSDVAVGTDIFVLMGVAGVRFREGRFGPWVRAGSVGLAVACPTSPCEADTWSVGAGLDGVLFAADWALLSVGGGVSANFWREEGTQWTPVLALGAESNWDFPVRPFLQSRFEHHRVVGPVFMLGLGVGVNTAW